MLKKLFTGEHLVELDNIVNSVVTLAECFIVSEVLSPTDKAMARYKRSGEPLSLQVKEFALIEDTVKKTGVIIDKEGREISTMELEFEDGRVKRYEFKLKGKLRGRKVNMTKFTTGRPERKGCTMVEISDTLERVVRELS